MKFLVGLVVVVGLAMGAYQLYEYWGTFKPKEERATAAPAAVSSGDSLPGLPPKLQPLLEIAQREGASGLKEFLDKYSSQIQDPRLAWIQLDYVELLAQSSPGLARQQFLKVKARIPPDSPVYPRIKELEKTYE